MSHIPGTGPSSDPQPSEDTAKRIARLVYEVGALWQRVRGLKRDKADTGHEHGFAHESLELGDLSSGTLGTWFEWTGSTITIPDPGRKVRVTGILTSGVLANAGVDTASKTRVSIDIGGGATTGKEPWLLTNDGGDAAIRRMSATAQHSVEGTPTSDITVLAQRRHQSGGSSGDVTHNDATLTVIVVPVD